MRRTLPAFLISAAIAVSAGCGAGDGPVGPDADPSAPDADPSAPDADPNAPDARPGCAPAPAPAPSWLSSYQDEIVGKLAGQREIATGVTLSDRATASRRSAAADYIDGELAGQGYLVQRHDYGTGVNVWAELASTDGSSETVVVGAHYDSVTGSPGANDNATGVAMVLSAARYLREVDCRAVNVIFVLFDQEEVGLIGSGEFAAMLASSNRTILSVHTIDQMGWDNDGDRAIELERADSGLFALYSAAVTSGGFSIPLQQTNTGSTDHVSFRAAGFRAIGITEEYVSGDTTPHYHQPSDTYATVNFAYLASTSALLHHALAEVAAGNVAASLPGPPPGSASARAGLPSRERRFEPGITGPRRAPVAPGCRHRR